VGFYIFTFRIFTPKREFSFWVMSGNLITSPSVWFLHIYDVVAQSSFLKNRAVFPVNTNSIPSCAACHVSTPELCKHYDRLSILFVNSFEYYILCLIILLIFTQTTIAMARGHAPVLSVGLLCTLFHSAYALDLGADFFQQQKQQPQVCQVYTLLESPVVIETLVVSNTVLFHPACSCEITITNAPTVLETTITMTSTLGQNFVSTFYRNPRYPT
jgi:hypothetical protein